MSDTLAPFWSPRGGFGEPFWSNFGVFLGTLFVDFRIEFFNAFLVVLGTAFGPKLVTKRSGSGKKMPSGSERGTLDFEQPFYRFPRFSNF